MLKISNKYLLTLISILFLSLSACGAVVPEDNVEGNNPGGDVQQPGGVVEKSFEERLQDWLDFIGQEELNDEQALQLLNDAGEGGCCQTQFDIAAYLIVLNNNDNNNDLSFNNAIQQLQLRNQDAFHSFRCLVIGVSPVRFCEVDATIPFDLLHINNLIQNYELMIAIAQSARNRIIETGAILGFEFLPVETPQELIETNFVSPLNSAIAIASQTDPSLFDGSEVPQVSGELLRNVSFFIEDETLPLSFFKFAEEETGSILARGVLQSISGGENVFTTDIIITP